MIDKTNRLKAASLLQQYRRGQISKHEFARAFPRSDDTALRAIEQMVWFCSSDIREHRLTGKRALNAEWQKLFDRCIVFLDTKIEYCGPTRLVNAAAPLQRLWRQVTRGPAHAFDRWWPFSGREQFESHGRSTH